MSEPPSPGLEWCILELMGHRRLAGYVMARHAATIKTINRKYLRDLSTGPDQFRLLLAATEEDRQ